MTTFLLVWPSLALAELGDPRGLEPARPDRADAIATIARRIEAAVEPLARSAPLEGSVDRRWYWAAPLLLDHQRHPSVVERLMSEGSAQLWEGEKGDGNFRAHLAEARAMVEYGPTALGRRPDDLCEVLAELALGGPAQCALRAVEAVVGLPVDHETVLSSAVRIAEAFRSFFNAPEVTATVAASQAEQPGSGEGVARYWSDVGGSLGRREPAGAAGRARPCSARLARLRQLRQRPTASQGCEGHRLQDRRGAKASAPPRCGWTSPAAGSTTTASNWRRTVCALASLWPSAIKY